jgi:hypothetical protein
MNLTIHDETLSDDPRLIEHALAETIARHRPPVSDTGPFLADVYDVTLTATLRRKAIPTEEKTPVLADAAALGETDLIRLAFETCRALVDAYAQGAASGGQVAWEDLDDAHRLAVRALALLAEGPGPDGAGTWVRLSRREAGIPADPRD